MCHFDGYHTHLVGEIDATGLGSDEDRVQLAPLSFPGWVLATFFGMAGILCTATVIVIELLS